MLHELGDRKVINESGILPLPQIRIDGAPNKTARVLTKKGSMVQEIRTELGASVVERPIGKRKTERQEGTMSDHNYFAQQGWECPKCGRILSPSMMWCPWCANKDTVTTTEIIWTKDTTKTDLRGSEMVYGRSKDSVGNEYWYGVITGKHKLERREQ